MKHLSLYYFILIHLVDLFLRSLLRCSLSLLITSLVIASESLMGPYYAVLHSPEHSSLSFETCQGNYSTNLLNVLLQLHDCLSPVSCFYCPYSAWCCFSWSSPTCFYWHLQIHNILKFHSEPLAYSWLVCVANDEDGDVVMSEAFVGYKKLLNSK